MNNLRTKRPCGATFIRMISRRNLHRAYSTQEHSYRKGFGTTFVPTFCIDRPENGGLQRYRTILGTRIWIEPGGDRQYLHFCSDGAVMLSGAGCCFGLFSVTAQLANEAAHNTSDGIALFLRLCFKELIVLLADPEVQLAPIVAWLAAISNRNHTSNPFGERLIAKWHRIPLDICPRGPC